MKVVMVLSGDLLGIWCGWGDEGVGGGSHTRKPYKATERVVGCSSLPL